MKGKMDVLRCNFQFFISKNCICYCIVIYLILFTLCYLSHSGFICNCILYTHLNAFSVFLVIYNFMAEISKQLFIKFILGEMTTVISSYIIFHVEPKEYMLHFKNVSYSF
ncbi:unnamed protein product [Pipistrellus nathusii]|uniref:Uncharacterized protein n=1 Tax=Pipistrellus nathusii TaxID=59473 RepID=A0ABP0A1U4_PIPNA